MSQKGKQVDHAKVPSFVGPVFGGFLDITNGSMLAETLEDQLRFHALFAEKIVVPDTFVHCVGPIYCRARTLVDAGAKPTSKEACEDIVVGLLREGVIRPLLRTATSSLEQNYESPEIRPGTFMFPEMTEARRVLGFLDATGAQNASVGWTRQSSRRSYDALRKRFLDPAASQVRANAIEQALLDPVHDGDWVPFLEEFVAQVQAQEPLDHFRRGPLERSLAAGLGIEEARIYDHLAMANTHHMTPRERLAKYLLNEMVTYYQVGHGTALADVAAITNAAAGHKLDLEALAAAKGFTGGAAEGAAVIRNVGINMKLLRSLTVGQIMNLRKGPMQDYRQRIDRIYQNVHDPVERQNAIDLESAEYDRKIAEKIDSKIIHLSKYLFQAGAMVAGGLITGGVGETIAIGVGSQLIADRVTEKVQSMHHKMLARKLNRQFNNFLAEAGLKPKE